ncbi:CD206 [Mytilus edulis]|uniref:MRC n=1 Tax=Mytilus edulis TaxID=6550 RepID=A0A8S3UXW7_MYTED|nr:CD206 [Mytilus edulis]
MQPLLTLICLIGPLSVSGRSCNYLYIPGPFDWTDGRDRCIKDGMDLAVMKDQETLEEVKDYVTTIEWTNDIWIGLIWNTTDLSFEWIDNEPLGLWTNWYPGEPDGMELTNPDPGCSYQNCVRILSTSLWRTIHCNKRYPVLCQTCTEQFDQQPSGRDNAYLCAVMFNSEMYDVDCSTDFKVVSQKQQPYPRISNTGLPTTFYNQTTNNADLETTTFPTSNTGLPTTFYNQTTNNADLETTTFIIHPTLDYQRHSKKQTTNNADLETTTFPTSNTGLPTTFYNQTTNNVDLETTTFPTSNTGLPTTFYNQTTKHFNLETTTLPATNTSAECRCNFQEPMDIPEIPNDIRLDKTTLSSYIRKKNSGSDPRKSSFYIGCVGLTVLVMSVLFIVVLDFLPRGKQFRRKILHLN